VNAVGRAELVSVAFRLLAIGGMLEQSLMNLRKIGERHGGKQVMGGVVVDVERLDENALHQRAQHMACPVADIGGTVVRMLG